MSATAHKILLVRLALAQDILYFSRCARNSLRVRNVLEVELKDGKLQG